MFYFNGHGIYAILIIFFSFSYNINNRRLIYIVLISTFSVPQSALQSRWFTHLYIYTHTPMGSQRYLCCNHLVNNKNKTEKNKNKLLEINFNCAGLELPLGGLQNTLSHMSHLPGGSTESFGCCCYVLCFHGWQLVVIVRWESACCQ